MKKNIIFKTIFLLIALLNFDRLYSTEEDVECEESLQFSFDNRPWKRAFENSNSQASIVEFTLKTENVDNWTELVTVQKLVPISATVENYYLEFMHNLRKAVNPEKVYSRLINKNDTSGLFEWWIDGKGPNAQHEWFKLIKTPNATLILRYTTKKLDDVEKVRGPWEKILNAAVYLKQGCPKKSASVVERQPAKRDQTPR
jgi:hypothetical protein